MTVGGKHSDKRCLTTIMMIQNPNGLILELHQPPSLPMTHMILIHHTLLKVSLMKTVGYRDGDTECECIQEIEMKITVGREETVNGSEENENDSESEDESSSDTNDSSGEEEMDIPDNPDPPAVTEECLLCKQQKSIIRFLPCGDSGICEDCSENWSHCCKCNAEIQSRVPKIYPGNMPGNGIECVVCTEPIQARIGFVPCGHTNCCMKCAQTIGNTDKKCPVCRESITKLMPLYE